MMHKNAVDDLRHFMRRGVLDDVHRRITGSNLLLFNDLSQRGEANSARNRSNVEPLPASVDGIGNSLDHLAVFVAGNETGPAVFGNSFKELGDYLNLPGEFRRRGRKSLNGESARFLGCGQDCLHLAEEPHQSLSRCVLPFRHKLRRSRIVGSSIRHGSLSGIHHRNLRNARCRVGACGNAFGRLDHRSRKIRMSAPITLSNFHPVDQNDSVANLYGF